MLGAFPIVQAQDKRKFDGYRTQDDVMRWLVLLREPRAAAIGAQ